MFEGNELLSLIERLRGSFYARVDNDGTLDYVTRMGRTVYSADAVKRADGLILVNATAANVTIGLPDATTMVGKRVIVKKTDSTANSVTLDALWGGNIDGAAGQTITTQYGRVGVQSDGAGWWIVESAGTIAPIPIIYAVLWYVGFMPWTGMDIGDSAFNERALRPWYALQPAQHLFNYQEFA